MLDKQINKTRILFESLKELSIKENTNLIIKSLKYDENDIKCICKGYNQHLYFIDSSSNSLIRSISCSSSNDICGALKLDKFPFTLFPFVI